MSSKYVDSTAITQVIGCVFNSPSILDLTDKYTITEEDFVENFHRILFGAIYKVHELGVSNISIENITDYLSTKPKSFAIYNQNKGEEYLNKISEFSSPTAFDYYYNRMKKMSLLRAYNNYGIDVSFIYDVDNILDTKKKQEQEEFLDNSSLVQIADLVDKKIQEVKMTYVDEVNNSAVQAGDGVLSLIEDLKKNPEVGVPLYGPIINTVTRGARLRKFYLRSAPTGCGKAIPNDILIPTPIGWRKVGDIRSGDFLFGQDGKPTEVIQIHPQPEEKDIWKVTFSDGRVAKCCKDHLWQYEYTLFGKSKSRVESLEKLYNRALHLKNGLKKSNGKEYRFTVKLNEPIEYQEQQYSIDPYIMGGLLGDNSQEIPSEYLFGSVSQRWSLLQGLLDSCGKIDRKRSCISFPVDNIKLRNSFVDLVRSLGMIAIVDEGVVYVYCAKKYNANLFRSRRKKMIAQRYLKNKDNDSLSIVSIEKTSKKTAMTCFTVNNKNHLFLMNDYIVTHNTRSLIADACYIGCNKLYDPEHGWINTGEAQPTLFITTEQDQKELQTMMLAFLSNVNEEHIINGYYIDDEEERVIEAGKILLNSSLYIEELPDFSLQDVENTIVKNIREHDIIYVMYDYIHTSMKILEEITKRSGGVKLREDNILFMLSTRLKDICNKYGIFILSATQLNGSFKDEKIPDQTLLRGAKSIADKIDVGCILLNTTEDDVKSLDPILSTGIFEKPNIKLSVYKNRRGRYKGIYLWCKADLGTCRIRPMFCTSYDYELVPIDNINIEVKSAF